MTTLFLSLAYEFFFKSGKVIKCSRIVSHYRYVMLFKNLSGQHEGDAHDTVNISINFSFCKALYKSSYKVNETFLT